MSVSLLQLMITKKIICLNGYDDIDYLMSMKNSITDFASKTPL